MLNLLNNWATTEDLIIKAVSLQSRDVPSFQTEMKNRYSRIRYRSKSIGALGSLIVHIMFAFEPKLIYIYINIIYIYIYIFQPNFQKA